MGYAQPQRRAVALSRFDLPDACELMVNSCEDCACAVSDSGDARLRAMPSAPIGREADSWVRGSDVVEFPLHGEYRILFNPLGSGGTVVVNESAYDIFRAFETPATVADVRRSRPGRGGEVTEIFNRLGQLQLIHPSSGQPPPDFQVGRVLTAWLHVTNGCNLRCPYCYLDKTQEPMDEATGRQAVAAVMRSAVANGFPAVKLKYAGGEASLNHRLVVALHAYARELAAESDLMLNATLLSNGVRLPRNLIQTCKAEGIRVMISLDGVGDQHDVQRPFTSGKPSFRYVERTIGELIAQAHPPHLSVTITNRNLSGIPDVVRFALERDLTFSLNLFRDNDCAAGFPDLRYEEQAMISALLETFEVIEDFMPRWSVLGSILDRGQLLHPRQRSCGVGQDYVVIDQHGRVAKCHMEIERTLGNVFAEDPLHLVRRDKTTMLNLLVDEKAGCRDCTWRYWCSGGCSVATFRATGRYDVKSPNCNIYKAIYPQALRLEALRLLKYATTPRARR
jgi:uncharacterized protein